MIFINKFIGYNMSFYITLLFKFIVIFFVLNWAYYVGFMFGIFSTICSVFYVYSRLTEQLKWFVLPSLNSYLEKNKNLNHPNNIDEVECKFCKSKKVNRNILFENKGVQKIVYVCSHCKHSLFKL